MPEQTPPKRKRGRPRKDEAPPEQEPVETSEVPATVTRSSLEWAEAVMWAIERANQTKAAIRKRDKNITPMQWALWDLGQTNYKELVVSLARQAAAILDKQQSSEVDDEVTAAEQEALKEIDELLEAAIEEAKGA